MAHEEAAHAPHEHHAHDPHPPQYMVAEFRESPLEAVNIFYVGNDKKAALTAYQQHKDAVGVRLSPIGGDFNRTTTPTTETT